MELDGQAHQTSQRRMPENPQAPKAQGFQTEEPQQAPGQEAVLSHVKDQIRPQRRRGRPPTAERARRMREQLKLGDASQIDRGWLLEQFMLVYGERDCKPADKLRALELMARISGYGTNTPEPEDEKKAIQDLLNDMNEDT